MLPTRQADFSVCTVEVLVHLPPSMTNMVAGLCYMVATAQTSLTVLLSSDLRARVLPARRLWPEGGKSAEQLDRERSVPLESRGGREKCQVPKCCVLVEE